MNIIFEILYLLSVFYLLALYFSLFRNVVSHRRETKTSLGHKGEKLERVIRAHSNFCETVPFNLFLSLILYFNNYLGAMRKLLGFGLRAVPQAQVRGVFA